MPAAPAAPPPAAAPKSAPAPAPKPADRPTQPDAPVGNEPTPESYLGDDMAELSEMDTAEETSRREPAPKRDERGKFIKPGEKPEDKPKEAPKEEPDKAPEKPEEEPRPGSMRALGKAYDEKVKLINHELQPKIQSLEAKTKDYERQIEELRKAQPDVKPFQEKLAAIEKENQQLREVVRFADYKKSPEFVEKYENPYNEAWTKAVSEVTQLSMALEDGTSRKATANDLLALANAPLDQLDDLAAQWFPKSAPRVIRHVEKIRDLADAQDKALKEAQKGAGEFQNKQSEAVKKANESFANAYTSASTELTTKYPKWFAPDEADPKGNEILKKGFEYADSLFSPNGTQLTPEQRAGRLAVIRAKAANHDRLVARVKANNARIAELEAKLAEFEKSEPPTDDAAQPGGDGFTSFEDQDRAELERLSR